MQYQYRVFQLGLDADLWDVVAAGLRDIGEAVLKSFRQVVICSILFDNQVAKLIVTSCVTSLHVFPVVCHCHAAASSAEHWCGALVIIVIHVLACEAVLCLASSRLPNAGVAGFSGSGV